jgi:hypothetical protein
VALRIGLVDIRVQGVMTYCGGGWLADSAVLEAEEMGLNEPSCTIDWRIEAFDDTPR